MPRAATLSSRAAFALLAVLLAAGLWLRPVPAPEPAWSLMQWLTPVASAEAWRVGRLQGQPAVLVIEFPDLATQGRALDRVGALVEQAQAPRDRVLADDELAALVEREGAAPGSLYLGHDYRAADLARFLALVRRQGLQLNADEQRLQALLLEHGVLQPGQPDPVAPPLAQALVSFTRLNEHDAPVLDAELRDTTLRHELSHGLFFTRPAYRDHALRFWQEDLDEAQREAFRRLLGGLGYDPRDDELMANETQAFLVHSPDPRALDTATLGLDEATLQGLRRRFRAAMPPEAEALLPTR